MYIARPEIARLSTPDEPLGRTTVNMNLAIQEQLDVSTNEKVSNALIKQIRKLRWIGMDAEASRLQAKLSRMQAADVVVGLLSETGGHSCAFMSARPRLQ